MNASRNVKPVGLMNKWELHITFSSKVELEGWSYSCIDGDPILGKGPKHYLTRYTSSERDAFVTMNNAMTEQIGPEEAQYLMRAKIEYIVWDMRYETKLG